MSHVWVLTRRSCHKHTYVSCVYLEKLIMSRPQNPVTLFLTRHQVVSQILPQFLDALLLHQNDLSVVLPCHCSLSLKNHRLQLLHNNSLGPIVPPNVNAVNRDGLAQRNQTLKVLLSSSSRCLSVCLRERANNSPWRSG